MAPRVIQVGKWAEGIAFDGTSIWIAESGQQSIAQIDLNQGKVARRVTVGRLPVGMATFTDGAVYALVQTDKRLWQQFPTVAKGKSFTGLSGCPTGLASGDQALWILSEPNCSSGNSVLIRLNPGTNARATSGSLGDGAQAIVATPGKVWVANTRSPSLHVVDQQTLAIQQSDIQGAALWALATNGSNLFAGGVLGNQGVVVSIDPGSGRELARQVVDQKIYQMAADGQSVVALSNEGNVYVFSAATLQLQRVITLTTPYGGIAAGGGPKAALIVGNNLYISSGQQVGENGALLVLSNWRPAVAINAPPPAPAPQPAPSAAPPAITVANCPYQIINTGDATGIWMYQNPDTSAPQVMAIPAASKGLVVDRCLVGWCHVTFQDKSGWVESGHIQPTCQ
ncbi:MAG: hypothetical protein WBF58_03635 [Xanthobacteraceae bacterium]